MSESSGQKLLEDVGSEVVVGLGGKHNLQFCLQCRFFAGFLGGSLDCVVLGTYVLVLRENILSGLL